MSSIYKDYLSHGKVQEHYNYTKGIPESQLTPSRQAAQAVILAICVASVLENLLVLGAVARNRRLHSAMYLFLGNLALSDLLAGATFMANVLLSGPRTFQLTPVAWLAREGSAFTALSASVFSLLAIAVERHVAVARVRVYGAVGGGGRRVLGLLGACWAVALAIGGLPILGWNCLGRLEACSTVLPLYAKPYVVLVASAFMVILAAIAGLYARIYCVARASHAELAGPRALALLRTVAIVLGVFVACWLPTFAILLLDASCPHRACPILAQAHYFFSFATLNSLLNPIIYTWRSRELRGEVLRMLGCRQGRRLPVGRAPGGRSTFGPPRTSGPTSPTLLEGQTMV
ncbi:sphingosine 1-phosphate receptor 2 [Ornithorhynchus anatinus]|uniref:Sphingosine-1-phosphate receptor 2 n=1 Tax=Ornithorhynchus anatinus TaxID=9258 RepID=A0A6I8N621_ORNAN|nr:sphingosine 1-phosphate receptor 2 [Ornithorhynchus anatinus]XP_028909342.1 sphingosine 1-phosphate receptor 2 [Ornithorhynchus anatinus]